MSSVVHGCTRAHRSLLHPVGTVYFFTPTTATMGSPDASDITRASAKGTVDNESKNINCQPLAMPVPDVQLDQKKRGHRKGKSHVIYLFKNIRNVCHGFGNNVAPATSHLFHQRAPTSLEPIRKTVTFANNASFSLSLSLSVSLSVSECTISSREENEKYRFLLKCRCHGGRVLSERIQ